MNRIVLRSVLSEIARIPAWVEKLGIHPPINESVQFAINLCLEEAISNVIRHGYASGEADSQVMIDFAEPREGYLVFTIEDGGAPFNPLVAPETPLLDEQGEIAIGGRGIRLMRGFADTLEYERTATGNRLRIGISNERDAKSRP
jgi:anti-sigma regulatory factor (Ser/Thr protein kinase)